MARSRSRARLPTPDELDEEEERANRESDVEDGDGERRDRSGGTVGDLRASGRDRVRSETAPGSTAALALDPAINPGFVDTEVVNRAAIVLSFQCVYDTERGYWTPVTKQDLASSAYSSGLLADTITEALGGVLGTQNGTTTNPNGDLVLDEGNIGYNAPDVVRGTIDPAQNYSGLYFTPDADYPEILFKWDFPGSVPGTVSIYDNTAARSLYNGPPEPPIQAIPGPFVAGNDTSVQVFGTNEPDSRSFFNPDSFPVGTSIGDITAGQNNGSRVSDQWYWVAGLGTSRTEQSGTATTAFANPERATRYSRALYNQTPNGGSVRVDLYSGDPSSTTSELLARDIDPREDLSDIPPSYGPLQLKIHMQRSGKGDSPRVSMAGVQYEK